MTSSFATTGRSPASRFAAAACIVTVAAALSACAPTRPMGGAAVESAPYVPQTGAAQSVVVPAATPGTQTTPVGASTAGSSVSETVTEPARPATRARRPATTVR